jgi:hypothetical protein
MLDRLMEIFCAMDDFCKAYFPQWALLLLSAGKAWECGLSESEIMTFVVLYHGSRYRYFKNFYNPNMSTIPVYPRLLSADINQYGARCSTPDFSSSTTRAGV